jgi:hypothetical protein
MFCGGYWNLVIFMSLYLERRIAMKKSFLINNRRNELPASSIEIFFSISLYVLIIKKDVHL